MPRAGEKRRSNERNDGDSAVPIKIEAPCTSTSSAATRSRNSLPEPADDVTSLHTSAEMEEKLEQKAQQVRSQCAGEYKTKIRELESNYANEKAQLLAELYQDSKRHADDTARLNAQIEALQANLKAAQEAHAGAVIVKKENVVDEQAIRQEMEQRFAEERRQMEQHFDEEKRNIQRTFDEANQKAEQEIASMKELLESQSQSIATLTNNIHELTAKATSAESETMEARQAVWQYYARMEALQKEVEVLRSASHAFPAPPASNATAAVPSSNQVYVGKLSAAMTEEVLGRYFSQFGVVTRIVVKWHPDQVSGYAFVSFSTPAEALRAQTWNVHSINGQDIFVGPSRRSF
ncbi:hypothetical protein AAVH_15699 [Aphelenchoides avenae]|nr:hypothetical protein AAVH_15699 [Aphelenchus avenae]